MCSLSTRTISNLKNVSVCKVCPIGRFIDNGLLDSIEASDRVGIASKHDEFIDCKICSPGRYTDDGNLTHGFNATYHENA